MEFISNEAVEDGALVFSDNDEEKTTDEQDDFIGKFLQTARPCKS